MSKYSYHEPYYSSAQPVQPIPVVRSVTSVQQRPWFDPWYLATIPGGLKMLQILGGGGALVAILLINGAFWGTYIAAAVSLIGFSCSLVLLFMHLYNLVPLANFISIRLWELVYTAAWVIAYMVASGIMVYSAVMWRNFRVQWGAAAALCVLGTVAHIGDTIAQVRERRIQGANDGGTQLTNKNSRYSTSVA